MATKKKQKSVVAKATPVVKSTVDKKELNTEIKRALMGDLNQMESAFISHWKLVVIAGVILVVLLAVGYGVSKQVQASYRVAAAELNAAVTIDALNKALAAYPDMDGAVAARLRLTKLLTLKQEFAEATKNADLLLLQAKPAARAGYLAKLGEIFEAAKQFATAKQYYGELANDPFAVDDLRAEGLYAQGRLAAADGDNETAIRFLNECTAIPGKNGQGGFFQELAKVMLIDLRLQAGSKTEK